jgi:sigma-B regulation protein RsbU (phosphoserine phosphatase)
MARSSERSYRLTDSVDASVLQEMQDAFAALAQVSMTICDAQGKMVTRPSCHGPLCRIVEQSPAGQSACAHSVEHLAEQEPPPGPGSTLPAAESTCHAGLVHMAVPIEFDGHHVGTIVVGDRPSAGLDPQHLRQLALQHGLDEAALLDAAGRSAPWTDDQRQATVQCARLLAGAIAHLCRQDSMIRDRVEELGAVYDMAGMLSGTQDLQVILDSTARRVAEVMRVKACAIRLLDEATGELVIKAVHNLSEEYLNKGPVLLGQNRIDEAAFAGETAYIADAATDPRTRYPEQARKEGIVSGLCVPMTYRGQTVGVMRAYTGSPHRFSPFEESLLRSIASQAAAAIVNARLFAQRAESKRYRSQLDYAGEIQRRMIPDQPPKHKNITLAGVYAPSLEVGGDFYDFIPLPWGNLGLCVADVVGKGVPAALMMASVRSALRGHAHSIYEINEIMAQVNRHLCRDTVISEFATLFYGVFSPDGGQITYCNAGHEPPLLLRGDEFRRFEAGGVVIGVSPDEVFAKEVVDLEPGDVLVFCTDGVTEALNFEDQAFGRRRLQESILRYRNEEVSTLAKQLLWDVRRFAGLAPQVDDITIVAARVGPTV